MDTSLVSRRQFVRGLLGAVVLSAGGSGGAAFAASFVSPRQVTANLSSPLRKAMFLPLIGESFIVRSLQRKRFQALITLVDIQDIYDTLETEQFSLVFSGPYSAVIPEDVYVLRHRTAGRLRLLLQPSGHDRTSSYYRAPFNLLLRQ